MRRASKRVLGFSALAAFLVLSVSAGAATPGELDASFGSGGKVTTLIGSDESDARAVVVQPDGKIVVGGWAGSATLALARFKPNGGLDPTFGSGGKATTSLAGSFDAAVYALALQPEGKIVAAGIDFLTQFESDFVVARYNANGSLDKTFGGSGFVTTDFDRLDAAHAVVIQPDRTIVVAGGSIGPGGPAVVLARYRPNGSLDPSFGSGGEVRGPTG
ncbi:MAG TPA: delta-60 repeat domain-containing protein, partial [Gaiellaceae bacterium]